MRRSYYTYDDIIVYLDAPIRALFETETDASTPESPAFAPILGADNVPAIEAVIVPEEDRIIQLGFSCIQARNMALLPICAAFLQYSLVQRSNQQLNVPYSQIQQSYNSALAFLNANKNMCKDASKSIVSQIRSRRRNNINGGW